MAHGSSTDGIDLKALMQIPPWEWPRDTGRRLLAILTDPDVPESDRLIAAELGGDATIVNDDLVLALLAIVEEPTASEALRSRAAISLGPALEEAHTMGSEDDAGLEGGPLGDEDIPISEDTFLRVRRSLRALYQDGDVPTEVRRRILEASVRAPEGWHGDVVRTACTSGESSWAVTAVFCMRFVPGFHAEILEALLARDREVQYQAVRAAGDQEVADAWPILVALATAEETVSHLRLAAIEALGSVRPRESLDILFELTETSGDDAIVEAAREALGTAHTLVEIPPDIENKEVQ